ncbi:MAG TPA: ABC transporter ATP-binding protein [Anaerolineaceae bacterium]|nr:ABC transporter ATP-binding protein [Anaerolineaceae bacterium]HOS53831.1 ABC transporter ATP-binding protein [Anaerolineaceae bacterium]HPD62451.1 ABC transporter ATP-binding protein [Anaerolineaceae bacterium]HQF69183.1 ABC transporter ATP-binding protein [Anaerolineaceae bacterium]HQK04987.1 ABC transporter ATP-binding protein [Anaerolineaceae bacterium]
MPPSSHMLDLDLKSTISHHRLAGIWKMMKGFRLRYIGAVTSLGLSALAKTFTFLLLRYFVDTYLIQQDNRIGLPYIALGFVGLAILEGGFTFLSGVLSSQTAEGITRRLRNYLYDHIQHLSFTYHSKTKTGELIERSTSDVDALRRFFSDQATNIGRILMLFIINFVTLLNLNVKLAWVSIIVIPFILAVSIFLFKKVSSAYESYQQQEAILSTTLQENLSGVRVVKAFSRQRYEMDKFEKDNWEKYTRGKKLLIMHSLFWPVSDILCGAQLIAGYLIGAMMAINGQISVGTYLAYSGLVIYIIYPLRNLGRIIVQTSTGLVSYSRVMDIIKEKREPLDQGDYTPQSNLRGDFAFLNVGFEYEPGDQTLADINFSVKPGQVIALLGSTGSGKSTLVHLLPRFYEYTSGKILLDGVELNRYPRKFLRQQIGIVEQEPFLFSRTIRENITYGVGREVSDEEVEQAARAAAIHDVILSFQEGYQTIVGERGVTLSGGQKQRVTIARTLLKNPRILILDDSTSSVDTETEAEIREALWNLMRNRTTFIIAHRIQSVADADLILVMDKGRIIQHGRHADLINQTGVYREIFNIQARIEDELEKELASAG